MKFKSPYGFVAFGLIALLSVAVLLWWIEDAQASDEVRSRYTITSSYSALLFYNADALPFQIIREMCWNDSVGWCDGVMQERTTELWIVVDWRDEVTGAIYQARNGECFWWMFQAEYGADNQPHIREHYWIECPVLPR